MPLIFGTLQECVTKALNTVMQNPPELELTKTN